MKRKIKENNKINKKNKKIEEMKFPEAYNLSKNQDQLIEYLQKKKSFIG